MPLELKRTKEQISNDLYTIAEEYGLVRTDRFVGGLIDSIVANLFNSFQTVYDLENQSRIDTATGEWLESWARIHGQELVVNEGGQDLSFENVYIATSNGQPASNYLAESQELYLPAGVVGKSQDGRDLFTTIDNVVLSGNRAFTRVVLPAGSNLTVAPGTYPTNISFRDYAIRGLDEVPEIVAVVQRPISSTQRSLTDEELRAIIFDRALSRNRANGATIRTSLQIGDVARVIVNNFNSGSSSVNIFVEPTLGVLGPALEARLRSYLESVLPDGTRVNIGRMVGSLASFKLKVKLPENTVANEVEDILNRVKQEFVAGINLTKAGATVNFDLISQAVAASAGVESVSVVETRVNGKRVALSSYTNREIEFIFTDLLRVEATT
jgi:hypothetical protein